ncbi:DoxX family protein [Herbaspirillum robiniae]|uniref:LysR family transcriptional regulator n=1 Tax=Herbaspirillum robiniae TaxID=2014887 RepID=A0A246WQA2_9BURK|nr:DoxX family protein [Herbaspirillum robiniae]OWY28555.1 LysR family transcriptional regulator [Herbaspirillum robiniae]
MGARTSLRLPTPPLDFGLLFLRIAGSFMLFYVHGLPKLMHYAHELTVIEDPFGFGPALSLWAAIFAEALCPLLIAAGVFTRLACLPVIGVLLVAMLAVHPDWSIAEGQFGWLLLVIFTSIALCGPGNWRLGAQARTAD